MTDAALKAPLFHGSEGIHCCPRHCELVPFPVGAGDRVFRRPWSRDPIYEFFV